MVITDGQRFTAGLQSNTRGEAIPVGTPVRSEAQRLPGRRIAQPRPAEVYRHRIASGAKGMPLDGRRVVLVER